MVKTHVTTAIETRIRSTAITPERLEAFCAVAETGSFRAAAERLFVSQPAVSMHVRILETYCQAPLLVRSPRGAVLTPAGKLLYDQARVMLEQLQQVEQTAQRLRRLEAGTLRIGISRGIASPRLIGLLAALRREHPQLEIEVRWGTSVHLAQQVAAGQLDAALVVQEFLTGHHFSDLLKVPCGTDQVVAVAAPSILHTYGDRSTAIACGPYVKLSGSCGVQPYVEACIPAVAKAETAIVLDDANEVRAAVLQGIGIAFLSKSTIEHELVEGQICLLNPEVASLNIQRVLFISPKAQHAAIQVLTRRFCTA
jgi:DNA-binding transcriptional LysR family regulator